MPVPVQGFPRNIQRQIPVYGENYAAGYIGFVHGGTAVSRGIAYLTRWPRMSEIAVSHVLIVVGPDLCVEADMDRGVVRTHLRNYFDSLSMNISFRKPRELGWLDAQRIVNAAQAEVGKPYDKALVAAHAVLGTVIGHLANRLVWGLPERLLVAALDTPGFICSELAAHCLRMRSRHNAAGCLADHPASITPQELFEDDQVFQPWQHKETEP
jgi:hypothetical protein